MLKFRHVICQLVRHSHCQRNRLFGNSRRFLSNFGDGQQKRDESLLRDDISLPGLHLDDVDQIMSDESLPPLNLYYPKLDVEQNVKRKPIEGHNLMVIQPWVAYANFNEFTEPDLQLEECVSLGNTIHNWKVVDKRIVFANQLNRKQILGPKAFEELKEMIHSKTEVSAVFFGVELLSAIQFHTLEKELGLAVFDRFTIVLNIFRQHARTKEAKLQLALAELPYIKSHLREIHESSEFSSSAESLKTLVGGSGEQFYLRRLNILKQRERKLKFLLEETQKQRELTKKQRRRSDIPTVSIVGYTNCGKTSLIKFLTEDERLVPKDQLFATLDVSAHLGQLPSSRKVFYLDTVGFLSRIPLLLIQAFSATLKDVQESDLIVHLLDVTHPDHKLQYITVVKALESLKVSKNLLETRLTIGNKADLLDSSNVKTENLPKCDLHVSVLAGKHMNKLVERIDQQLMANLKHEHRVIRIENGGKKYTWLKKNATIIDCHADENDANYLICRVIMSPTTSGRWRKQFGSADFLDLQ
jgi:GTP-binding protein HflX